MWLPHFTGFLLRKKYQSKNIFKIIETFQIFSSVFLYNLIFDFYDKKKDCK